MSWLKTRAKEAAADCCGTSDEIAAIEHVAREFAERVGTYMTDYVEGQNPAIYRNAVSRADKEDK